MTKFEKIKWSLQYAWITIKHKWFVVVAGIKIGVPLSTLLKHDNSKFSLKELPHYGQHFFGDKGNPDGFAKAWLHHQKHNKHHWEYWSGQPVEMPDEYVLEMIADWMGAGRAYTGSWDISEWFVQNNEKMKLHPLTRAKVVRIIKKIIT
jgi:hypothetical protein